MNPEPNPEGIIEFPWPESPIGEIVKAHKIYCEMTGQNLSMRFDRERMWYELLKEYSIADVRQVIAYLQREIRDKKRNVGALKLSNLLQLDRFEEDFQISRVRLKPRPKQMELPLPDEDRPKVSEHALAMLRKFKETL